MCGLVVVIGRAPVEVTGPAVQWAGQRGPHEHGAGRLNGDSWQVTRATGRLTSLPSGRAVIGHSRLATCGASPGDAPGVDEAQPYAADGYLVAHNGTITADVLARFAEPPLPPVDSQVLLSALAAGVSPPTVLADAPAPSAVIWAEGERVFAYRHPGARLPAHPLFVAEGDGWLVASSGPIPGCRLIAEAATVELDA